MAKVYTASVRDFSLNIKAIVKFVLISLSLFIFMSSPVFGIAIAIGILGSILYFKNNSGIYILVFCVIAVFLDYSLLVLYDAILPAILLGIIFAILNTRKKQVKLIYFALGMILARSVLLIYGGSAEDMARLGAEILLSSMFFVIAVNAFKAPAIRGINLKMTVDEAVCYAAVTIAFFAGLYSFKIYGFYPYIAIASLTILVSIHIFTLSFALTYSIVIGIAVSLLSGNPVYLGTFAIYALCANIFKDTSSYLSAVAVVLVDLLFAYLFNVYEIYSYKNIITISAGALIFLLISKQKLARLSSIIGNRPQRRLSRDIINRTRAELNLKLLRVSEVFYEMERIFSGMIKGYMSPEDAVNMLANDAISEVCGKCTDQQRCFKHHKEIIERGYKKAIAAGIDKGKTNLLDLPEETTSICTRTNAVLSACSNLAGSYRQYAIVVSNMDSGRALLGRQFKGVGDIIKQLAAETKNSVGFDIKTERLIIDELAYNNIACSEAVVYNENEGEDNISLLLKTSNSFDKNISKIISTVIGKKMIVCAREESKREGYSVLHLKSAPKFDVVFGAAGCAKQGRDISGDTHTLSRISDDKFLLALCDGMGSGQSAEKISSTAISMVENFYRAGFDSETILSGINRLLNVGGEDNFAALDICALDLKKGVCDFIKLGSPHGYIKRRKNTEVINSNALPVGILEELKPSIDSKKLETGDIIVLLSDGISDAFEEVERLKEYIFSSETINPQTLAENIMQQALKLNGGVAKDDMTVLTMRVYTQV